MQTVDDILSGYNLSESEIQRIMNEAKVSSVGCGTRGVTKQLPSKIWTLLDDISDEVWYSQMEVVDKISLGFQLYEKFPSYYHFLVPFYHGVRNNEIVLPEHKNVIWKQFIQYLESDAYYADPVSYVLWVEFFEDVNTVRDAWQGLLMHCHKEKTLISILEIAGPVPFDLKEEYYNSLIIDKVNHEFIFDSLFHSAFEFYGNIDAKRASVILDKLNVDTKTENYKLLKDKLERKS